MEEIEPIPSKLREEIMAERDEKILKKWLLLAARAKSMGEFIEKCHCGADGIAQAESEGEFLP